MSFSDLRSVRKAKEAKSFVKETLKLPRDDQSSAFTPAQPEPELTEAAEIDAEVKSPTPPGDASSDSELVDGIHVRGLPDTLEIRKNAVSGRGVYAADDLSMGSVLISLRPRVAVLSTNCLETHCSWCTRPSSKDGLKRCTRCRTLYYCDTSCQNKDWPSHKNECSALQKWAAAAPSPDVAVPNDAVRCIARTLWEIQRRGTDSEWAAERNMLQSHRTTLQPATFESFTHLAHSVVRYLDATSPEDLAPLGILSAGDLVDIISRFTTNAFTLTTNTLAPIGVCYSPTMALVNHSCDPNAVMVFPHSVQDDWDEPNMQLIAIKPIREGEQVFISYVDTTLPKEIRQKGLSETYNFTCRCTLCSARGLDPRTSVWCPNFCGGTCPTPMAEDDLPRCCKCNALVRNTDIVLDALHIGQQALDKATRVQFTDPAKAKQLTTNLIPILTRSGLTPSSHPLLAMLRLHQEMLIGDLSQSMTQEALDQAIQTAAKSSTGLSDTLPYGHPVRAIALVELGRLLAVDEPSPADQNAGSQTQFPPSGPPRLKLAYETLLRARNELLLGFGKENEGGKLGQEVRETLVQLEKELGVWTEGIRNALEDVRASKTKSR